MYLLFEVDLSLFINYVLLKSQTFENHTLSSPSIPVILTQIPRKLGSWLENH